MSELKAVGCRDGVAFSPQALQIGLLGGEGSCPVGKVEERCSFMETRRGKLDDVKTQLSEGLAEVSSMPSVEAVMYLGEVKVAEVAPSLLRVCNYV